MQPLVSFIFNPFPSSYSSALLSMIFPYQRNNTGYRLKMCGIDCLHVCSLAEELCVEMKWCCLLHVCQGNCCRDIWHLSTIHSSICHENLWFENQQLRMWLHPPVYHCRFPATFSRLGLLFSQLQPRLLHWPTSICAGVTILSMSQSTGQHSSCKKNWDNCTCWDQLCLLVPGVQFL